MSIRSFRCSDTQALFERRRVARFANIQAAARRKLEQPHMAGALSDLSIPPGNRLEKLSGDRLARGVSASTTNGACASSGWARTRKTSRSSITTDGENP
jgi:plasmid maintenance system killer protein